MSTEARFASIALADLRPNEYNARRFEENMTPQRRARFEELVASVARIGVIEPLLVRPLPSGGHEVIAGERRYRASLQAGLIEVPCMVREVNDDEAFDLMVIENLQREDLTPLETAQAFQAYLQRHGDTAEAVAEISARTGIPTHAIRRQVRFLDLPPAVLSAWKEGVLSTSHVELLTRLGDQAQVLELLSVCLRSRITVRELTERIGIACPELDRGFFDKTECQVCHYNTAVQSGLFADSSSSGKCGNSGCFEVKQADFLNQKWTQSKAAEKFGTRGFRFGHRLGQEHREPVLSAETAPRCLACDMFISVLRLTGAVVSGYERTCTGPVKCFEELYRSAPAIDKESMTIGETSDAPAKKEDPGHRSVDQVTSETKSVQTETKPAKPETVRTASGVQTKAAAPAEETGPVWNGPRGERYREGFIKEQLPQKINAGSLIDRQSLILLAIAVGSLSGRQALNAHLGLSNQSDTRELAVKILDDMLGEEVDAALRVITAALLAGNGVQPEVRRAAAACVGVHVSDWAISKEYLEELNKSEIIRVGEEPGVAIWTDEKVEAYRAKHHKGKALLTLKKEELIDMILESGVQLAGRVPAEVLGAKKG